MYEWNVEHDKQAKWEMEREREQKEYSELNFGVSIFVKVVTCTPVLRSACERLNSN